jgi:hypothetical protein
MQGWWTKNLTYINYPPFPMTLMISVVTTLPPEEHSTLVPFKLELTLSITISDVRGAGEVEVLKN